MGSHNKAQQQRSWFLKALSVYCQNVIISGEVSMSCYCIIGPNCECVIIAAATLTNHFNMHLVLLWVWNPLFLQSCFNSIYLIQQCVRNIPERLWSKSQCECESDVALEYRELIDM